MKKYPEGILSIRFMNNGISDYSHYYEPIHGDYQTWVRINLSRPSAVISSVRNSTGNVFMLNDDLGLGKRISKFEIDPEFTGGIKVVHVDEYRAGHTFGCCVEWLLSASINPPLGFIPLFIHQELRYKDVMAAIQRCRDAGKEIPKEWIEEERELAKWIVDSNKAKFPEGILAFIRGADECVFDERSDLTYQQWVQGCLDAKYEIISVKNKNRETFRVGDTVLAPMQHIKDYNIKIVGFYIYEKYILIKDVNKTGDRNIDTVEHLKETFKTADGYDIGQEDECFVLDIKHWFISRQSSLKSVANPSNYLIFKDNANAQKYVELQTPRYSIQQLLDKDINPNGQVIDRRFLVIDKSKL